jgi:polysaccharide chain length determinant protein (PEP-CTERM system associated)
VRLCHDEVSGKTLLVYESAEVRLGMNPLSQLIEENLRGVWRFRWVALAVTGSVAALGWLAIFALPDRYEAGVQVVVDSRTALKPALQGLATDQDVSVQLNYVRQSLLAGPQLRKIAQQIGALPATGIDPGRQEQLLTDLKNHIQFTVQTSDDRSDRTDSGSTTYGIIYQDTNRERALRLVSVLLKTMINETLGSKQEGSQNAQQFLGDQIKDYEARLRAIEDRLAEFKSRHFGQMPTEQGGYFQQLQKQTEAIEEIRTKLIAAQNRRNTLEMELHGDAAISSAGTSAIGAKGGQAGADTVSRIAETQAHLDELLLKYTERHPDVIATRQALVDLKQRRAVEIERLHYGDASAAATSGASASPVYQNIQLALNQADVDISDLRSELAQREQKVRELRELLNTAPQIEAEYAQLNRDYDVNKAQYTALLSNYEKARLGERADRAGSVRFEVVQPPTVGFQPVFPARTRLLSVVLFVAIAAGAGIAYGLDRLWPVVVSIEGLAKLTGMTVLSAVGPAFPTHSRQVARRKVWQVSLACAVLFVAFLLVLSLSRAGLRLSIPAATPLVQT